MGVLFRICQPLQPLLPIGGEDFVYLTKVLRLRAGDFFESVQEKRVGVYKIENVAKKTLTAVRQKEYAEDNEPAQKLHLVLPLLKSDKLDYVLQKCTEVGVHKFWLYESERSPVRWADNKLERWRKIIVTAVCQSRRNHLPAIERIDLAELSGKFQHIYYAHPAAEKKWPDWADNSALVIGPESGFAPTELNYLAVNAQAFALGGRILRAETAAVALAARILF
ncbi:16S ribosomal RNA methyltransferase RsmE [Candidatus Termititenax persephonae]|uniref:Ribosomal RNA small subunit methyltransferase E n=1 Tax=Candidatus Termititenax persephonae TaxID=2218525 RepID=A0A388THJ9_9BACT|nr:16S ribosomal RNA methyltransferase RsmE [Candidatus Termititenax persephonae]